MTGQDESTGDAGTLEEIRQLEQALDGRTDGTDLAAGRMAAAQREADDILTAARAAGIADGRRRVAALLDDATAQVVTIRATGTAHRQELNALVRSHRSTPSSSRPPVSPLSNPFSSRPPTSHSSPRTSPAFLNGAPYGLRKEGRAGE